MAITTVGAATAEQTNFTLSAPLDADPGDLFRLDDEVVSFGGYYRVDRQHGIDRKHVAFHRGAQGTTRATHANGTTLRRVADALAASTDETEPDPFAGGEGGGGVSVDNGADPPTPVATLVAPGATVDGDEATLYPTLVPSVNGVEIRAPAGTGYPDFSIRSVDHPDDYVFAGAGSALLIIRTTDYPDSPILIQVTGGAGTFSAFEIGNDGSAYFRLGSGGILRVRDSNAQAIFRIDEDGSVHIKTGTSIVADL